MGDAYCPIHGTVSDLHDCRPLSYSPQAYHPIMDPAPSRRERIATAALHGILAAHAPDDETPMASDVRAAVEYADLMIAELDKEDDDRT